MSKHDADYVGRHRIDGGRVYARFVQPHVFWLFYQRFDEIAYTAKGPVPEHDQPVTHSYRLHYPAHPARTGDPHYRDFDAYRRRTKASAVCAVGGHRNDFSECQGGLELHHSAVEFSLQNGVDLKWLEADYPGISNADEVGAWVESAANLEWLCERHHRGADGVHLLSASDWEAAKYVRGLVDGD
jgi:hypothetical protein